jgi:hypothetical protein
MLAIVDAETVKELKQVGFGAAGFGTALMALNLVRVLLLRRNGGSRPVRTISLPIVPSTEVVPIWSQALQHSIDGLPCGEHGERLAKAEAELHSVVERLDRMSAGIESNVAEILRRLPPKR